MIYDNDFTIIRYYMIIWNWWMNFPKFQIFYRQLFEKLVLDRDQYTLSISLEGKINVRRLETCSKMIVTPVFLV